MPGRNAITICHIFAIFKLHIKLTNILSSSTIGDGSCGFRAPHLASKRAAIPIHLRDNMPIRDVGNNNEPEREAQVFWAENFIRASAPDAHICWTVKDIRLASAWRHRQVKLRTTTPRSERVDSNKWLPCSRCDTSAKLHDLALLLSYFRWVWNQWTFRLMETASLACGVVRTPAA